MLRQLARAALAALLTLTLAAPALALSPAVLGIVTPGGGPIQRLAGYYPVTTPASGCWAIQARNVHTYAPDTKPETVSFLQPGFDTSAKPTLYRRDLVQTQQIRQAWPAVGNFTDKVALENYVYRGATGLDAGVNTGGCTADAPQAVANFALPARKVINASVSQEVVAFHRDSQNQSQVAAVICRATDVNGLTVYSTPVSAMTISPQTYDLHAVLVYACTVDTTTLAAGLIKFDAAVYPWYGGSNAVLDSANSTDPARFSTRYYLKDATLAASPYYAWVCPASALTGTCTTPGNDSTCNAFTVEASAIAAPCLTIDKAIDKLASAGGKVDGGHVRVGSGTFTLVTAASTRTQNVAEVVVEKDPAVADSSVIIQVGASVYGAKFTGFTSPLVTGALRFSHIYFVRTGVQGWNSGSTTDVIWENVDWDGGGFNANYLVNTLNDSFFGATIHNTGGGSTLSAQSAHEHRVFRGSTYDTTNAVETLLWLGNTFAQGAQTSNTCTKTGQSAASSSGVIIAFNVLLRAGTQNIKTINGCDVDGFAFVQNVIEYTNSASSNVVGFNNDGQTNNARNELYDHVTIAGYYAEGRDNNWYDEGATARTTSYQSCKGGLHVQLNTKSDYFRGSTNEGGTGAATASYRTGNWGYEYGVGCRGVLSNYIDANNGGIGNSFAQIYPGLGAKIGTSSTNPTWIPNATFTNYQAASWSGSGTTASAGAGGGSYPLSAGSAAANMNTRPGLPYDIAGTARGSTATCAGAYECAP
ncbi:MAG: hypothetical protein JF588_11540 [Caulobacterales bacterium]|nr:hypothetical protein [Caulobacterales bacterium]